MVFHHFLFAIFSATIISHKCNRNINFQTNCNVEVQEIFSQTHHKSNACNHVKFYSAYYYSSTITYKLKKIQSKEKVGGSRGG